MTFLFPDAENSEDVADENEEPLISIISASYIRILLSHAFFFVTRVRKRVTNKFSCHRHRHFSNTSYCNAIFQIFIGLPVDVHFEALGCFFRQMLNFY